MKDKAKKSIVINVAASALETSQFTSTMVELGPGSEVAVPDIKSRTPYLVHSRVAHGQTQNSHFHDCYSLLMFTKGSYEIGGKMYETGSVVLIEPKAPTGECFPGPNGVTEIGIYEHGYGSIPFFFDETDPRARALFIPEFDQSFFHATPRPEVGKPGRAYELDRAKHGVKTSAFTAYPCQIGPDGFGARPNPADARPFAALVEFMPGAVIPEHSHDGWSCISVIDGVCEVSGNLIEPDAVMLKIPPGTPMSFKIGPKGARAMIFFDSGAAVRPRFANPADPVVKALVESFPT